MAKFCNVCKQPYSEALADCPRCAAALVVEPVEADITDSTINLRELLEAEGASSSEIPLGPGSKPSAVSSRIEWASLVDAPRPEDGGGDAPVEIDAPADAGLRRQAGDIPSLPLPSNKPPFEEFDVVEPIRPQAGTDSGSEIDLGRRFPGVGGSSGSSVRLADYQPPSAASRVDWASVADAPSGSDVSLASPPSGFESGSLVPPPPAYAASEADDSVVEPVEPTASDSQVDLLAEDSGFDAAPDSGLEAFARQEMQAAAAAAPVGADEGDAMVDLSDSEARPISDSGRLQAEILDLGPESNTPRRAAEAPDLSVEEQMMLRSDAEIDLGELPPAGPGRSSSRDLIAEAVESGVDLGAQPAGKEIGSSDVLSSLMEEDGSNVQHLEEESEVPEVKKPSRPAPRLAPLSEPVEVEERHPVAAAYAKGKGEGPTPYPGRRPQPAKGRSLGGILLGGLGGAGLATAACVGLWSAGVVPPPGGAARNGSGVVAPANPGGVGQLPGAPAAGVADALALLKGGDPDKALAALEQAGDEPAQLAARGEARWLQYLKAQSGKGLTRDNASVKTALEDLKKADTLDSLFWTGQILESTGDLAGARKSYQEGMTKSGPDAAQKRLFEAALDRLDLRTPARPGGTAQLPAGADAGLVVLFVTGLQAGQPATSAEAVEAGYYFWKAAKAARAGQYAQAVGLLKEARKAHEERRYAALRKQQNPATDPTEEIFLRACDEIIASWEMRESFRSSGALAQGQDPTAALRQMVADSKRMTEAMTQAQTQLKQEQTARANLTKEVGELTEAQKKAAQEYASLDAKYKAAQKGNATAQTQELEKQLTAATQAAQVAAQAAQAAEGKLKTIGTQLASAGVKSIDELAGARRKALQERDDLDARLKVAQKGNTAAQTKELEKQLAAATLAAQMAGQAAQSAHKLAEAANQAAQAADSKLKAVDAQLASAGVKSVGELAAARKKALDDLAEAGRRLDAARATSRTVPGSPGTTTLPPVPTGDPVNAEVYYEAGLRYYKERRYGAAEQSFEAAVRYFPGDARYLYFLGLARLGQGRIDEAGMDFQRAVQLERDGRPGPALIGKALERVQGPGRAWIEHYRQ